MNEFKMAGQSTPSNISLEKVKEKENSLKSIILELGNNALIMNGVYNFESQVPRQIIYIRYEPSETLKNEILEDYNIELAKRLISEDVYITNSIKIAQNKIWKKDEALDEIVKEYLKDNAGAGYTENKNIRDAIDLCRHDYLGLLNSYAVKKEFFANDELKEYQTEKIARELVSTLISSNQLSQAVAYIASGGDGKYITKIPFRNVGGILKNSVRVSEMGENSLEVKTLESLSPDAMIETPEFISLFQIAKNALKYGGGKIEISMEDVKGTKTMRIRDYGNGIKGKDNNSITTEGLPHIFDKGNTSDKINGTGVGLYIVKELNNMRKNNVSVATRFQNSNKNLFYSIHTNKAVEFEESSVAGITSGVEFAIYRSEKKNKGF